MSENTAIKTGLCGLAGLSIGLMLAGCSSSSYMVDVEAIRAGGSTGTGHSYVLAEPLPGGDDHTFGYAAGLVRAALADRGMVESPDASRADVVIAVDFGVGPRQLHVRQFPAAAFDSAVPGSIGGRATLDDRGGISRAPATPAVGTGERFVISYVYRKHLSLSARQNNPGTANGVSRELWRVTVATEDGVDSIVDVLPVLANAAIDHIGTDTDIRLSRKRASARAESVAFSVIR